MENCKLSRRIIYIHFRWDYFILPYASFLESVSEYFRKNCKLFDDHREEFLQFRKSNCYWFNKRSMEDSEDFWYF